MQNVAMDFSLLCEMFHNLPVINGLLYAEFAKFMVQVRALRAEFVDNQGALLTLDAIEAFWAAQHPTVFEPGQVIEMTGWVGNAAGVLGSLLSREYLGRFGHKRN